MLRGAIGALLIAAALAWQPPAHAQRFAFAVLGDAPYFAHEERMLAGILEGFAAEGVAFAVHVGDIKAGSAPCTDETLAARRALLDRSSVPLVFTPGDNEWSDCHRPRAGGFDPAERLNRLREIFHAGAESLGRQRMALARQSDDPRFRAFRENARWLFGEVVFVTINVPGSNNNLGRDAAGDREHARRMDANFEWLDEAVKIAERSDVRGLVVLFQADPRFEGGRKVPDGYERLRAVLRAHAGWLKKPMLVVHGDGHRYRVDRPLRAARDGRLADMTRVEVFGSPEVNWVRVEVDPGSPALFSVSPGIPAPPPQ